MDKILKQFGENRIKEAVTDSNSFVEVTAFLGLDSKNVNIKKNVERAIKRLGLSTDHFDSVQRLKNSKNRYSKEKLEILVNKHKTYKDILEELDILPFYNNYNKLKWALYRYNIDFTHLKSQKREIKNNIWNDKELLSAIIKDSKSQKEVLEKMNLRSAGGNFNTLRKYIEKFELDTSHFIKNYEMMVSINKKIPLEDVLIEKSTYARNSLKDRLYSEGLKERKCELCGQDEEWQGKKMSLILDHKNGIHNDNRLENLRIVCPNCNATLDTHCGKNIKKDIKVKINNRIEYNVKRRTVERPSLDELKKEIELLGLEGTGRKYNVTGNSIKKWVKTYEKYGR